MAKGQDTVRRALRQSGLRPEEFAAKYRKHVGGRGARSIRRWAKGESRVPDYVIEHLAPLFPKLSRTPTPSRLTGDRR